MSLHNGRGLAELEGKSSKKGSSAKTKQQQKNPELLFFTTEILLCKKNPLINKWSSFVNVHEVTGMGFLEKEFP